MMENEDILAPAANPDLIGHTAAEKTLLAAWNSGRFPHAVMLVGRRGIGKATLAYRLARFVFSQGGDASGLFAAEAPNTLAVPVDSPVFAQVAARSRTDFRVADLLADWETQAYDATIGIDKIREFSSLFQLTAGQGGWRVAVIDAVDDMTLPASNSLLKILEEPPPRCLLILVCHSLGAALPTIRSRCFRVSLSALSAEDAGRVVDLVRSGEVESGELEAALALAQGSPGDALSLLVGGAIALHNDVQDLIKSTRKFTSVDIGPIIQRVADRNRPGNFLLFCRLMRDVLERDVLRLTREQQTADAGERAHLARLLEVWEEINQMLGQTDALNLDRGQAVVKTLSILGTAAR